MEKNGSTMSSPKDFPIATFGSHPRTRRRRQVIGEFMRSACDISDPVAREILMRALTREYLREVGRA